VVVVDGPIPDFVQLRLMSLCLHFILANSSFGWWAAYLSHRGAPPPPSGDGGCGDGDDDCDRALAAPPGLVVVPRQWFGPAGPDMDPDDLFPSDWIVV
jgi:hypothetical protein